MTGLPLPASRILSVTPSNEMERRVDWAMWLIGAGLLMVWPDEGAAEVSIDPASRMSAPSAKCADLVMAFSMGWLVVCCSDFLTQLKLEGRIFFHTVGEQPF